METEPLCAWVSSLFLFLCSLISLLIESLNGPFAVSFAKRKPVAFL